MMSSMCEGIDNAKKEKPMKPELKVGRKVIAWEDNVDPVKGRYIKYGSQEHWILDDTGSIMPFQHVKPDLDATPMNGDEVEGYTDPDRKIGTGRYVGIMADGRHLVETEMGAFLFCDSVRHPQPSKRERVIETLKTHEEIVTAIVTRNRLERLADEILKITEDE